MKGRRAGDPPAAHLLQRALMETLDWTPRYADIDTILGHALEWERKLLTPELGVKLLRLPLLALAALLIGAAPPQPISDAHAAERIRAHVEFLASDLLEGRDTGSRGHRIAANYVAAEFRKLGLKPGGTNGSWFVEVPFRRATLAEPPAMSMTLNGRTTQLVVGKDAAVRPSVTERDLRISRAAWSSLATASAMRGLDIDDYAGPRRPREDRRRPVRPVPRRCRATSPHICARCQARTAGAQGAVGFIEIDDAATAASQMQRFATPAGARLGRCAGGRTRQGRRRARDRRPFARMGRAAFSSVRR